MKVKAILLFLLISSISLNAQGWGTPPNQKYFQQSQLEYGDGNHGRTGCGETIDYFKRIGCGNCAQDDKLVAFTYNKLIQNRFQIEVDLDYSRGWSSVWLVTERSIDANEGFKWNRDKVGSYYVARNTSKIIFYYNGKEEDEVAELDSDLLKTGTILIERNSNNQIVVSVTKGATVQELYRFKKPYADNFYLIGENQCSKDGQPTWINRTQYRTWFDK